MAGSRTTCTSPETASTPNHSSITGPKALPTVPVPQRWMANSADSTHTAIGSTHSLTAGATTCRPSTAPSTEMAGVITLSP